MKSSIRPVVRRVQRGFTMIELIVVIVILGILAATALPRFIDLRGDAANAAIQGVAGNMASAMSVNFAGCSAAQHVPTPNRCIRVNNCRSAIDLIQGVGAGASVVNGTFTLGGTPYTIDTAPITANSQNVDCTVRTGAGANAVNARFAGVGAGI